MTRLRSYDFFPNYLNNELFHQIMIRDKRSKMREFIVVCTEIKYFHNTQSSAHSATSEIFKKRCMCNKNMM